MRKLLLIAFVTAVLPASAATVDRIAAVIDEQVLTVTEVGQMAEMRFFPRTAGESDDEYRREILESLIAQALRLRDVERFGAPDITAESIDARLQQIQARFPSVADFEAALIRAELSLDEFKALIKRQLQVEEYIQERFAPLVFVSNEEIEERRRQAQPGVPIEQVRTTLRGERLQQEIERWTNRLRLRANVDVYAWR
ncbi:MAG TPA: hypothetical protein VFM36_07300 [Thermoanaerobaculia bacterium]|nr:hypothetical protein [Thermoanaerobaculia bacterium]